MYYRLSSLRIEYSAVIDFFVKNANCFVCISDESVMGSWIPRCLPLYPILNVYYVVMYIFIQPPRYNGPTKVIAYSENIFRSIVLDDRTSSKFIVMFDARWASGIEYVRALFAELSLQYVVNNI